MTDNVVRFPKTSTRKEPDLEEIQANLEMMKLYHIQETIQILVPIVFTQLGIAGFDLDEDEDVEELKDGAFLLEALRSIMCKHYGIYHPFQEVAESIFSPDKEDIGALKIADSLQIDFKKRETT